MPPPERLPASSTYHHLHPHHDHGLRCRRGPGGHRCRWHRRLRAMAVVVCCQRQRELMVMLGDVGWVLLVLGLRQREDQGREVLAVRGERGLVLNVHSARDYPSKLCLLHP